MASSSMSPPPHTRYHPTFRLASVPPLARAMPTPQHCATSSARAVLACLGLGALVLKFELVCGFHCLVSVFNVVPSSDVIMCFKLVPLLIDILG